MVSLSKGHIIIDRETVQNLFDNADQVNWVFYAQKKILHIASGADTLFKSLHKTAMSMLKYKNEQGIRSLSVQELLIDQELDGKDRDLKFFADEKMKVLNIYFSDKFIYFILLIK